MERTPHYAYQHAGQYWLTEAIRRSGIATSDMEAAGVMWFDSYCYHQVGAWCGWVRLSSARVPSGHCLSQAGHGCMHARRAVAQMSEPFIGALSRPVATST